MGEGEQAGPGEDHWESRYLDLQYLCFVAQEGPEDHT